MPRRRGAFGLFWWRALALAPPLLLPVALAPRLGCPLPPRWSGRLCRRAPSLVAAGFKRSSASPLCGFGRRARRSAQRCPPVWCLPLPLPPCAPCAAPAGCGRSSWGSSRAPVPGSLLVMAMRSPRAVAAFPSGWLLPGRWKSWKPKGFQLSHLPCYCYYPLSTPSSVVVCVCRLQTACQP